MPTDTLQIAFEAIDKGLEKQINAIDADLTKLEKQIDSTNKSAGNFGLSAEQIGSKMASAGKALTIGLTVPIAGLAVAATKAASDLNETMNKVDVLFGDQANVIKKWSETSATAFGQSKQHALDSAASFAMFAKSAGLAGNEVTEFAKKHTVLASDLASFNNTSPQEAFEAIGSALRGETEPIRRYNVLINEATLKDEALRQGLIKTTTEALTPQQKILATSALIFKQTTAAQGDYARTADGVANATRTLNEQFQDTLATLGQALLPTVQKVVGGANDLLQAFNALDQPQKDLIVGFGLMAAAAGPVLTIGGKLISVFGAMRSVSIDAVGGFVTFGKTIGETAGYLKTVGISAESLKFAFQNLKASGALLTAELGVIVIGLIAIGKYLEEVSNAAKASSEDLIEMSHSGDVFKQAAATTEIFAHGQDRLKVALDGTHEKIRAGAKNYADYRASIEATAKAAGYQINANGDLVQVLDGMGGRVERVVQANYAFTESTYKAGDAQNYVTKAAGNQAKAYGVLDAAIDRAKTSAQANATEQVRIANEQIEGLKALAEARTRTGDAEKSYQDEVRKTMDVVKAQNGAIADAYSMAIQYTESQNKQADVQKELDDLNAKIAAHGAVRTVTVKNEKLSTEELARTQLQLAAAQEDLITVQRKGGETDAEFALRVDTIKGKITDYSAKLGEHTAVVGGATKAELEQKTALEGQIAALQKADEVTRAKQGFDALTQAFRNNIITSDQFKERAEAYNSVTHLYTASALEASTSQEIFMKSLADPTSEAWRSQLIMNKDAIDGVVASTDKATDATDKLNKKQAEAPPPAPPRAAVAKAEEVELGGKKYGASVEAAQAALDFKNKAAAAAEREAKAASDLSVAQEAASRNMKGAADIVVGGYNAVNNAIADTRQRTADMSTEAIQAAQDRSTADEKSSREMKGHADEVAKAYKAIPKNIIPPLIAPKADTKAAATDITALVTNVVNVVPKEKSILFIANTTTATRNTNDILKLFNAVPKATETTVNVIANLALQTIDDVLRGLGLITDKSVTVTVKYKQEGEPPEGFQRGGSYIVPPNPRGGAGDYFPVLAAPGERVTVQTRAQQNTTPAPMQGGDTFIYNTTVESTLAMAMYMDKQRRDRLARSNARMGVI